jgi:hypothetical protein
LGRGWVTIALPADSIRLGFRPRTNGDPGDGTHTSIRGSLKWSQKERGIWLSLPCPHLPARRQHMGRRSQVRGQVRPSSGLTSEARRWIRLRPGLGFGGFPNRPKNIGRFRSDGDDPEGADSKDRRTRYPRTGDLHYRSFRYRRIKEIGSSLSPSSHLLRSSLQQSHSQRPSRSR